ncbi:hypothetical protein AVEN_47264-1 [Araneus ventricosus]|uniref:Uncharacterized protein n=1 Tax=Araneus ventricosus TaxID=182803 RepID=A0A4Y2GSS9_ARAVE|nr:hypothetical protein AVEN_47264-1 [Araneus ventricosus]
MSCPFPRARSRSDLMVRFRCQRVPGLKPDSTEDPPRMWVLEHVKSDVVGQMSFLWCGVNVWRGWPAQVWSSSFDYGSKFRVSLQISPLVASK